MSGADVAAIPRCAFCGQLRPPLIRFSPELVPTLVGHLPCPDHPTATILAFPVEYRPAPADTET